MHTTWLHDAHATRRAPRGAGVLAALVVLVAAVAPGLVVASPAAADVEPGTIVVARQEGDVVALLPNGTTVEIASGLGQVQSFAVLADGTMLTTDFAGNRLMGFGGRLGATPVVVAEVDMPSGVSVGTDGSVYLTSLDGLLYRVDVDGRAVVPFADGLTLPGNPAEANGVVYVPQGLLGAAAVSTVDGAVTPLGAPVGQPGSVAAAKSTPILFSDTQGNKIFRYDPSTTESETFVELTSPGPIAIDPTPTKGQAWSLLIGTPNAVVRVDAKGGVQERIEVDGTIMGVGQATVTIAVDNSEGTSSTTVLKEVDESGGDGFPITIVLAALLAVVAVAGVYALVKRSSTRERGADWFKNPPAPPDRPPAGGTEVADGDDGTSSDEPDEPARSPQEEQLAEVRSQLADLTQRAADLAHRASIFREMVSRSLETRTNERLKREREALMNPSVPGPALTVDQIALNTEAARELFGRHQRGEIDNAALRSGWQELGEADALEQVFRYGDDTDRADLDAPSPVEWQAAHEAFEARQELAGVEAELAKVTMDINRLRGLEVELNRRVHGMEQF